MDEHEIDPEVLREMNEELDKFGSSKNQSSMLKYRSSKVKATFPKLDDLSGVYLNWGQLKEYVNKMTEEELKQPVQVWPPQNTPEKIELNPVYGVDNIKSQCAGVESGEQILETRGCLDNQHHPEHHVLLSDYLGFDEEGNTSYTLEEDLGFTGDKTGNRIYDFAKTTFEMDGDMVKAGYILLSKEEKVDHTNEISPNLLIDYNKQGKVIGIEILAPFKFQE